MISRKLALGTAVLLLAAISRTAPAAEKPLPVAAPAATASAAEKTPPETKLAALAAAAHAAEKTAPKESFEKYQVIVTNNIFERVHRSSRTREPRDFGPAPVKQPSPEEATVLRGIVRQLEIPGAPYFAYLENVQTSATMKVRMGDPVCQGKLMNPTLDSVDYVKNGVAKRIEIGRSLAGTAAPGAVPYEDKSATAPLIPVKRPDAAPAVEGATAASPDAPSAGASPASTTPPEPPDADSIAEQLRLKRLKDLTSPHRADWSTAPSAAVSATPASTALPASPDSVTEQMRLKRLKDLGE